MSVSRFSRTNTGLAMSCCLSRDCSKRRTRLSSIQAWHRAVSLESADTTLLRYTQCNSHQIQAWTSVPYKITTSIHHCCTVLQCTSLTFIHKEWEVSIDRLESYLRSFLPLRSFHHHEWFCTGCFCCVLITYYDFFKLLIYKIMMCMQITSE